MSEKELLDWLETQPRHIQFKVKLAWRWFWIVEDALKEVKK